MLKSNDLQLLSPHLNGVVNIEVKDRGRKGREVLLEYSDGRKLIGNLDQQPFALQELKTFSSIASYFARGKYGNNSWRGNCSGLLIRDLLQFYKPATFGDLAVGGGTSIEVAKDLGYSSKNSVFNDLNPKYGGIDISDPEQMDFPMVDFLFFHPPYYVFPGSGMPVYSGDMWGKEANPHDGSRITDPMTFKRWFDQCNANLYRLLRKGGRLAILMGDSRYKGKYYSMFKNMDIFGDMEQVIIKQQHNCLCDAAKYAGKFIPLEHEYLVVIKKNDPFIIPVTHVSFQTADMRTSEKSTWASIIAAMLEANGGKMSCKELVGKMETHPKGANNHHVDAKLRQELQKNKRTFYRDGDMVCLAACT